MAPEAVARLDGHAHAEATAALGDHEGTAVTVAAHLAGAGTPVAHVGERREVGPGGHVHLDVGRFAPDVADDHLVVEPVADRAVALDHEGVAPTPDEHGPVRVEDVSGQRLGRLAVHLEAQRAQDPGVAEEHPVEGARLDVARARRDADAPPSNSVTDPPLAMAGTVPNGGLGAAAGPTAPCRLGADAVPSRGRSRADFHYRGSANSRVVTYAGAVPDAPLFELRDLHVRVAEEATRTPILQGVDLTVRAGEVHALMGPNGSGKSTLASTLLGSPEYAVTSGSIRYKGDDITSWDTDVRGKAGIFLAFQYPQTIPGVSVLNFLRQALSARKGIDLSVLELRLAIMEWMERLDMDPAFLDRHLNDGFSGGEKKRNEILQMAILEPDLAVLDETDSGLDIDALKVVASGVHQVEAGAPRARRPGHHPLPAPARPPAARRGPRADRRADRGVGWPGAGRAARGPTVTRRSGERAPMTTLDVEAIKKDFPILSREVKGQRLVYLDSASSSQKPRRVLDAMERFQETSYANVHRGVYEIAVEADEGYEGARDAVARFIGAPSGRSVVFTKNVTESINLVAHSWGRANLRAGDAVLLTEMEHHANIVPWLMLAEERDIELRYLPVADDHTLDLTDLERLVDGVKLVSVTAMSNVLGTLTPDRAAGRRRPRPWRPDLRRRRPVGPAPAHRRHGVGRRLRRLHRPQDAGPVGHRGALGP